MRNKIFLIITITLLMFGLTACAQNNETVSDAEFEQNISKGDYHVDIMGITGDIHFDTTGVGTLTVGGNDNRFNYSVSNVSDDAKEADITITDTGYSQIDGKSIHAKIVDDGLKVTYSGISYTLKRADPENL